MPVDQFRKVRLDGADVQVSVPTMPVLVIPGGDRVGIQEWLYSTQVDLDRAGNCFGVVTERNGLGLPSRIDLVSLADVTVRARGSEIYEYEIAGEKYNAENGRLRDVWHERQFTVAGSPLGLSPVAHAAWTLEESFGAQKFALDWFGGKAVPMAALKNIAKTLTPRESTVAKDAFNAAISNGDLFVHGRDWEYKPIQSVAQQSEFLATRGFGLGDIARFFGCPGDMIDAAVSTGSITYASMTQRNLQFLIMHLGPAVMRRETALSRLTPSPHYVKLNRSALLAMDPATRATTIKTRIDSRTLTPNEARALEDLAPLTDEQYAEFGLAFTPRATPLTPAQPLAGDNATNGVPA
jgi:HK97 family phage portal protein